ncbi:ribonuclease E/G [Acetobacter sp.]|uniref:ribonuclease E/G n=1 Tax=Acetobacter sp. TaxID=440 RepID=UPI0039EBF162
MKGTLRVACSPGEARIAVFEQGELRDFGLWTPGHSDHFGDVFFGRVTALAPALGGAFVALGLTEAGFLPIREDDPPLHEGELLAVRVVRCGMSGKGPRLKREPDAIPLQQDVHLIKTGPSALDEMASRWEGEILVDSPAFTARISSALRDRMRLVPNAWDESVQDAVETLTSPTITLPRGMTATITPTPALVAIDMDTASASAGRVMKQTAQFALNRDAFPALVRHICLRNLSGAILVDPAGLSTPKRQALRGEMEKALQADPLRARCLSVTALGLVEIVRARVRPPLHEILASPHGRAMMALRDVVSICAGQPAARPVLEAGLSLTSALAADPVALEDVALWCGHPLVLRDRSDLSPLSWNVVNG